MFKFKFNAGDGDKEQESEIITEDDSLTWLLAEEIIPSEDVILNTEENIKKGCLFICGDREIGYILYEDSLKQVTGFNNAIALADENHSDLVAATYEGGLKIWECTYDLVSYLDKSDDYKPKDAKILDLGCGTGIVGIAAFLDGSTVHFQDYNPEVLHCSTIPNILLNCVDDYKPTDIKKKCRFYSGDWNSFAELRQKQINEQEDLKYDYILTSETIYNTENQMKLLTVFKKLLKKTGTIYLAAKTYYFGVGGGTRQFEDLLRTDGTFSSKVCWLCTTGVQREILKITFCT